MNAYNRLTAFVDWNSQIRLNPIGSEQGDSIGLASRILRRVGRAIAKVLSSEHESDRFLVDLRLYHGWHRGFEPTINRKALVQALAATDFSTLSNRQNTVFSGEADFGDRLINALPRRVHGRLAIHLPNTLRTQDKRRAPIEKMVDTALAADLVSMAARDPTTWLMVVAEDDDFVPPIFAAEGFLAHHEARVLLLRSATRTGPFLKLDSLLCGETHEPG